MFKWTLEPKERQNSMWGSRGVNWLRKPSPPKRSAEVDADPGKRSEYGGRLNSRRGDVFDPSRPIYS